MDLIESKLIGFDQGLVFMHNWGPLHLPCKTTREKEILYNKTLNTIKCFMLSIS